MLAPNEHGPDAPHAQPAKTPTHTPVIVPGATEDSKRFSRLAARAALAGHQLHQTASGFMLSRWSHSRHCIDLDTVETLLSHIDGFKPKVVTV